MWSQGAADETDPSSDRHDRAQDIVGPPGVEGSLVEIVDLALDELRQLEVADDDFVHQGREQVRGGKRSEPSLAIERVDEPLERGDRTGMHGQDHVMHRHQVDLPPDEARRILVVGLHRLERQLQALLSPREPGTARLLGQSLDIGVGEAEPVGDGSHDRVVALTIDVHPQELTIAELRDLDFSQVDLAVVAVGIE